MPLYQFALPAGALILIRLLVYDAVSNYSLGADLCQWDCNWYLSIAQHNYDRALHLVYGHMQANWAFFPAFPLLVRLVAPTGISPALAGILILTFSFWVFAVVSWIYRARTRPTSDRWTWLLLLLVWPYGFLFNAPYTESLYAALVSICLLAYVKDRPFLAASSAALLAATRPTGILLAAWIAFRRLADGRFSISSLARESLLLIIAPLGLIGFMLFLYFHVGDALAFVHVQAGWDHSFQNPVFVFLGAVYWFQTGQYHILYIVAWTTLGLLAGVFLARAQRPPEAWLCVTTVVVALLSGTIVSMPRYVACNPSFLFAVADLLEIRLLRRSRPYLLTGAAALQYTLLVAWYRGAAFLE